MSSSSSAAAGAGSSGSSSSAAAAAAHLANAAVNLTAVREAARKGLCDVLDGVETAKALVMDRAIASSMNLVLDFALLQEHGVQKIHMLESAPLETPSESVVFLTRAKPLYMRWIAKVIQRNTRRGVHKANYTVCFVPRRSMLCERVLMQQGVLGDVQVREYQLGLIPVEEDVLSMEMPLYHAAFVERDPTNLYHVAKALMTLQTMFGLIPRVLGKGAQSQQVFALMERMRDELHSDHFNSIVPEVHTLILVDRSVDLVTPLLTQLSYEGAIDEIFGIRNGVLDMGDGKKVALNSGDPLYSEARDMHFRGLGRMLKQKAARIQSTYQKKDEVEDIKGMKSFMSEFKSAHESHNSLQRHIEIAEKVYARTKTPAFENRVFVEQQLLCGNDDCLEYIEACIAKRDPFLKVLRLLALYAQCYGCSRKTFDALRSQVLQMYGFEKLFVLQHLEEAGLFASAKSAWANVRKRLRLVRDGWDEQRELERPSDYDYFFDGYAPLSARLVELGLTNPAAWREDNEKLAAVPGPTFRAEQPLAASVVERAELFSKEGKSRLGLVFFVGGCTFSEIGACRWIGEERAEGWDVVVGTTRIVSGDKWMEEVADIGDDEEGTGDALTHARRCALAGDDDDEDEGELDGGGGGGLF